MRWKRQKCSFVKIVLDWNSPTKKWQHWPIFSLVIFMLWDIFIFIHVNVISVSDAFEDNPPPLPVQIPVGNLNAAFKNRHSIASFPPQVKWSSTICCLNWTFILSGFRHVLYIWFKIYYKSLHFKIPHICCFVFHACLLFCLAKNPVARLTGDWMSYVTIVCRLALLCIWW